MAELGRLGAHVDGILGRRRLLLGDTSGTPVSPGGANADAKEEYKLADEVTPKRDAKYGVFKDTLLWRVEPQAQQGCGVDWGQAERGVERTDAERSGGHRCGTTVEGTGATNLGAER